MDGSFAGEKMQFMPDRDDILLPCTEETAYMKGDKKGYRCKGNFLAVIEFENTGSDKRKRLLSPIMLTSETATKKGKYYHVNSAVEWGWDGPMPKD